MFIFVLAGLIATLLAYLSERDKKGNRLLVASFFIMWFIASFQDCIGNDFIGYKEWFDWIMRGRMDYSFLRSDRDYVEIGWYFLNKSLGTIFGTFYAVTPVVYAVMLYPVYKLMGYVPRQWRWVSVFFFYFGIKLFLFDMSGQRQGLAVAFFILLVFALKEKKYILSAIYVLLGMSFHNSFIYSLIFIPLIFIPYERINFNKPLIKVFWIALIVVVFLVGYLYVQELVNNVTTALSVIAESEETDVYGRYIKEMEANQIRLSTAISQAILLFFVMIAFVASSNDKGKYENMFFVLYIFSFIMEASMGGFGTLPRMFRYPGFFAIPAIGLTAYRLKGINRYAFLFYMAFSTLYTFWASIHTEQFEAYLNYHTIFFQ